MTLKGYIFTTYVQSTIEQHGFGTRKMPRRAWGLLANILEEKCPDELALHFHNLDVWKRELGGKREGMSFKQYIAKYEEKTTFGRSLRISLGKIEFASHFRNMYVDELVNDGYMTKFQTKDGIFTKTYYGISNKGWKVANAFLSVEDKEFVIDESFYIQPE